MEQRLEQAKEQDIAAEAELDRRIAEINEDMERTAEKAAADKEKRYADFLAKYNGNLFANKSKRQIKREFELFGKYKDALGYIEKLNEEIKKDELRLNDLNDEKREIMKKFAGLGRFSGKKRKELEYRLEQIRDEMEKIENEMKSN